jgi:DNA gyrase inhibitor GyrI
VTVYYTQKTIESGRVMPMVEQLGYKTVEKSGEMEIREYPETVIAVVRDGGDDDSAFGHLFRYISGENRTAAKISMTAPVITPEHGRHPDGAPQKIDMTAPVISREDFMAFVLPSRYDRNTAPAPTDPRVTIESLPPRKVAVVRFSGNTTKKNIEGHLAALEKALNEKGLKSDGEPLLMRYNSPFMPGFLRHNEIGIQIK